MYLLAAITLGFLGSFHCIGMCGPIALSIPLKRNSYFDLFSGSVVYNAGRVFTYSILGFAFGIIGKSFQLAGLQNTLSVVLGLLVLLLLLYPKYQNIFFKAKFLMSYVAKIKILFKDKFQNSSFQSLFIIGGLNGFLPCGLVYMGVAGSIATVDALQGALFMAFFGLGTFPAMIAVSSARNMITVNFRNRINKFVPFFVGVMAFFLILRGLNLGIPYVSPSVKHDGNITHHECCKKPQ